MEEDSILKSIKGFLGIQEEDEDFDQDILLHINTMLSTLYQIGVGDESKHVFGSEETWADLFYDVPELIDLIKEFIFLKTRLLFDPPSSSFVLNALAEQVDEAQWRIHIQAEGAFNNDSDPKSDDE